MRVTFTVGIGYTGKEYGSQPITDEVWLSERRDEAIGHLCEVFGGVSIIPVEGAWKQDGKIIREDALQFVVEIPVVNPALRIGINLAASRLRTEFQRDSVIVTLSESVVIFVESES